MSFPTKEQIEEYIESIEEYVSTSFTTVAPDISAITETINRLWADVSRFGHPELPPLPTLQDIPVLGNFEIPPPRPLPPPPPELAWTEEIQEWMSRHRVATAAICVGLGLAVAYGAATVHNRSRAQIAGKRLRGEGAARRKVVVVLGGDTPLGPPLVAGLEKEGYIVITSVASTSAVTALEAGGNGYVRALVLDPAEPSTVPMFLRSLQATLALKFPLHHAGDPYQSTSTAYPYVHSVISLLSLPTLEQAPLPTPLEHLNVTDTYTSYLQATHIVPLRVIQGLLPLFRVAKPQQQRPRHRLGIPSCVAKLFGLSPHKTRSIIVCVPAADALVGIPFASAQAMSAAATVRGAEVLRRELTAVSTIRNADDTGERYRDAMSNIKVVIVDVGVVGPQSRYSDGNDRYQEAITSLQDWTPAERLVYGDVFDDYIPATRPDRVSKGMRRTRRHPTSVQTFVNALIFTVGHLETHPSVRGTGPFAAARVGLGLWYGNWKKGFTGERFSIGAGARTYHLVSYLPTTFIDALLNLPTLFMSIRNRRVLKRGGRGVLEQGPRTGELLASESGDGSGRVKTRSRNATDDTAHENEGVGVGLRESKGSEERDEPRLRTNTAEDEGKRNIRTTSVGSEGESCASGDVSVQGIGTGQPTVDSSWISVQDHQRA